MIRIVTSRPSLPDFRNLTKTVFATTVIWLLSINLGWALHVEFLVEEGGRSIPQVAEVQGDFIRVQRAGGDPSQEMLFNANRDILLIVNHKDKSYLQIDYPTIDQVAAIMDSVSTAVESQQGVLSDLLSTFGLAGEKEIKATLKDTGKNLTIAGYSCRLLQAHLESKLQSEICVAENNQLNIAEKEFATLRQFMQFGNRLLDKGGRLLTTMGIRLPEINLDKVPGVPIGMHTPGQKLKVRVSKINSIQTDFQFGIPKGYRKTAIPFIAG